MDFLSVLSTVTDRYWHWMIMNERFASNCFFLYSVVIILFWFDLDHKISLVACHMVILILLKVIRPILLHWIEIKSQTINLCESIRCISVPNCKYIRHLLSDQIVRYLSQDEFSLINYFFTCFAKLSEVASCFTLICLPQSDCRQMLYVQ